MKLDDYFAEIESLAFQIQFSVLSGLSVVEFALSRDKTVDSLLALLKQKSELAESIYCRIRYLLPRASEETKLSYDESIVAYLYCLNKTDLLFAYRASILIWDADGLLWSRWLAFRIMQFVQEVEESIDVSSVHSVSGERRFAEQIEYADIRSPGTTIETTLSANHSPFASLGFEFSTAG